MKSITEAQPIILEWNGVELPKALRTVKPGQYLLLPFKPPDPAHSLSKKAA